MPPPARRRGVRRVAVGLLAVALAAACAAPVWVLRAAHRGNTVGVVYPVNGPLGERGVAAPSIADSGPPLLFVDQERVPGPGLLAQAEVSGAVRLFQYDQPAPGTALQFAWVLRNTGARPVAVTVTDAAAAPPSRLYLPLAASVQRAFLTGSAPRAFVVGPGQIHILHDPATAAAGAGALAFSVYDLRLSGSLQVLNVAADDLAAMGAASLPTVYPGGGGIGALFPHDTRTATVTFAGGRDALRIAAHDPQDPAMVARDEVTGLPNTDEGNYGMTYRVRIVFPASRQRSANLWVTAGGCDLRADFRMGSGPLAGKVLQVPADGSLPHGVLGAALATVALSRTRPTVLAFSVLPPAASCTPITVREEPLRASSLSVQLDQSPLGRWLESR
jgi:hypothetical protein